MTVNTNALKLQTAPGEDVLAVSQRLIAKNLEAYKELAK